MSTICAHCGQPDANSSRIDGKALPVGDFFQCPACGNVSVSTGDGMRRATAAELAEADRDWHRPRTGLPAMIAFDGRG